MPEARTGAVTGQGSQARTERSPGHRASPGTRQAPGQEQADTGHQESTDKAHYRNTPGKAPTKRVLYSALYGIIGNAYFLQGL